VPCIALPVWCSTRSFEPVDHYERATDTKAALAYADAFFTEATRLNKTGGFKIRPRHIERAPLQWQALVRAHGVRIIWQYVFFVEGRGGSTVGLRLLLWLGQSGWRQTGGESGSRWRWLHGLPPPGGVLDRWSLADTGYVRQTAADC